MFCKDSAPGVSHPLLNPYFVFIALAVLAFPAASRAQVTFEGAKPAVYFGSVNLNSTSAAQSLSFSIHSGTTVGSIAVLTLGIAGKDFADAGESTCVAESYSATASCVVNVSLKPHSPGWRRGAVVFYDGEGNTLATVPLYGSGAGPQIAFLPTTQSTLISKAYADWTPSAVATDPNGNVYVADVLNNQVLKVSSNGVVSVAVNGAGHGSPYSITFDGAGNLYVVQAYFNVPMSSKGGTVGKYAPTSSGFEYTGTVGKVFNAAQVAVDGSGDVYIGDTGVLGDGTKSPAGPQLVKVTPAGVQTVAIHSAPAGYLYLNSIVDGPGNLYFVDGSNEIHEYSPNASGVYAQKADYPTTGLAAGLGTPALDGGGNFYFMAVSSATGEPVLVELTRYGQQTNLFAGAAGETPYAAGIALDNSGNVYGISPDFVTDTSLVKYGRGTAVTMNFPTHTAGGSTDSKDGAQTITVQNIGNETLEITGVVYPEDFPKAAGDATACFNGSKILHASCTVAVDFAPVEVSGTKTSISLRESVAVNTNTLNVSPNRASLYATGTETKLASKMTLASSINPSTAGGNVDFTAAVSGSSGTPGGTVEFLSGGVAIGTAALSGGKAVYKTSSLGVGSHTITASYSGSAEYATAGSSALKQTVAKAATSVALTSSTNPATAGSMVTFKATVATVGTNPAPTGTVQFLSGGVSFATVTLAGGTASASTSTLSNGMHAITAVYSGDEIYLTETSGAVKEIINP